MNLQSILVRNAIGAARFRNLNGTLRYYQQRSNPRRASVQELADPYAKDWKALELPQNSDQTAVRKAFLNLAKLYHPDSRSTNANALKFQEIDNAYKNLQRKFADERHNRHKGEGEYGLYYQEKAEPTEKDTDDPKEAEPDIKHTAPQHRNYLNFDGIGIGTPAQREKQYQKYRASKAIDNVYEHRIKQVARETGTQETALAKDAREAKKIKTGLGMERLVEDLIQESMARGDFENLSGKGKPLQHDTSYNPYIDFTTHKLNQVLIDNGFTPEWILLEKEIRTEIREIRESLRLERHKRFDEVLSSLDQLSWHKLVMAHKAQVDVLNIKINKYNLVVPTIHKQIIGLQLERESRMALQNFSIELKESLKNNSTTEELTPSLANRNDSSQTFLGMMFSMFKS